jgi:hypothetical protein
LFQFLHFSLKIGGTGLNGLRPANGGEDTKQYGQDDFQNAMIEMNFHNQLPLNNFCSVLYPILRPTQDIFTPLAWLACRQA